MHGNLSETQYGTRCDTCAIHNKAVCRSVDTPGVVELNRISRIKKVSAGETILSEKSPADLVGNVISGVVKLAKTLEDGRQQVVGLLFPSDFFGHPFAEETSCSFEAASDVELCIFERHAFEALLNRHPEIEHEILLKVLTELDAAREWMVLLGCQNAKERLASFFLMLLRRSPSIGCAALGLSPATIVKFPIGRKDIAMFLGTTLETISRQIQAMSKSGILKIIDGNTFEILSPRRLAETACHKEWLADYPI